MKSERSQHSPSLRGGQPAPAAPAGRTSEGEDPFINELQALWDEQDRHIVRLLAEADSRSQAPSHRGRPPKPIRLRLLAAYAVLSVLFLTVSVYWVLLFRAPFPSAAGLAVEAVYLSLFALCLYRAVGLAAHDPAREGILRYAHTAPLRRHLLVMTLRGNGGGFLPVCQVAAIGMVAIVILSFTTSAGTDGYTIAQNYSDRFGAIAQINDILHAV